MKYISPLAGVLLGVWLVPLVERKKSQVEADNAMKAFFIETGDLTKVSERNIKHLHDFYKKVVLLEHKKITLDEDFFPISTPSKISLLTYDWVVEKAFLKTTQDIRTALRALNLIVESLNAKIDKLPTNLHEIDKNDIQSLAQQFAIFYYLMSRLSNEAERFSYFSDTTDEEIRKTVFCSLDTQFDVLSVLKNL